MGSTALLGRLEDSKEKSVCVGGGAEEVKWSDKEASEQTERKKKRFLGGVRIWAVAKWWHKRRAERVAVKIHKLIFIFKIKLKIKCPSPSFKLNLWGINIFYELFIIDTLIQLFRSQTALAVLLVDPT